MNQTDIYIRPARLDDALALCEIYNYYIETSAVTFDLVKADLETMQEKLKAARDPQLFLVLEYKGELVAYAYSSTFKARPAYDWSCELSIYSKQGFKGKGFGKLLYTTLLDELQQRGFKQAFACISLPKTDDDPYLDQGSPRFHEALGFSRCGLFRDCAYKFGRVYDMIWMQKELASWENSPERPSGAKGAYHGDI